jgi:hypothetical protein
MSARKADSSSAADDEIEQNEEAIATEMIRLHFELGRLSKLLPSGHRKAEVFDSAEAQWRELLCQTAPAIEKKSSYSVAPEIQYARISAGLEDGAFDKPSIRGPITSIVRAQMEHVNEQQCKQMRAHGWSDDPAQNQQYAQPGQIVYVVLFEPLKNKDFSSADSQYLSTPGGAYIQRRYRAVVSHTDRHHWYGNLLGTRNGRGLEGLPAQEKRDYRKVNDQRVIGKQYYDGATAAFSTQGPMNLNKDTYVHFITRSFPFAQMIQPTGTRLAPADFLELRRESTRSYNEKCSTRVLHTDPNKNGWANANASHSPSEPKFSFDTTLSTVYNDKYPSAFHITDQFASHGAGPEYPGAHDQVHLVMEKNSESQRSLNEEDLTPPIEGDANGCINLTPESCSMGTETYGELFDPSTEPLQADLPSSTPETSPPELAAVPYKPSPTLSTTKAPKSRFASGKRTRDRVDSIHSTSAPDDRPGKAPRLEPFQDGIATQKSSIPGTQVVQPYTKCGATAMFGRLDWHETSDKERDRDGRGG